MATISGTRASTYDFHFVSSGVTATGQFTVDSTTQEVTDISGSVSIGGLSADTITNVIANPVFPAPFNNGPFVYDNIYLGGNPVFDNSGVAFETSGNPGGSWNLWGNGLDSYSLYEWTPNGVYPVQETGALAVFPSDAAAAPELSTWAMMLTGFAGLGYAAFRAGRKESLSRSMA